MVRKRVPGVGWVQVGEETPRPELFTRADGTKVDVDAVLASIKNNSRADAVSTAIRAARMVVAKEEEPMAPVTPDHTKHERPTARQQEVWDAVQRLGSQTAAARHLATTQGSIQSALKGYMARMGLKGDLPGAGRNAGATPARVGVIRSGRTIPVADLEPAEAGPSFSDVDADEGELADAAAPLDGAPEEPNIEPVENEVLADLMPSGRWLPTDLTGIDLSPREDPFRHEAVVSTGNLPVARTGAVATMDDFPPIVWGSLAWLAEHAGEWTAEQRAKWVGNFTAALDLAYPPAV